MRPVLLILLLLAACSHDAHRDNLLDPQLTPAVGLSVALDDTTAVASLRWAPYEGSSQFAAYVILRQDAAATQPDTIAVLADVSTTTFVDTTVTPGKVHQYWITVVNAAGLASASSIQRVDALRLPTSEIEELTFDSASASAHITWTPYHGPRFARYEVWRHTDGLEAQKVAELTDLATLEFTETALHGGVTHTYEIVVVTNRGERAPGSPRSGSIHGLLAVWPLDEYLAGLDEAYVRLYDTMDGIQVLIAARHHVELLTLDTDGNILRRVQPLDPQIDPSVSSVCLMVDEQGNVHVGASTLGILSIMPLDANSEQATITVGPLQIAGVSGTFDATAGRLRLQSNYGGAVKITFDDLHMTSAGTIQLDEDFSGYGTSGAGNTSNGGGGQIGPWHLDDLGIVEDGAMRFRGIAEQTVPLPGTFEFEAKMALGLSATYGSLSLEDTTRSVRVVVAAPGATGPQELQLITATDTTSTDLPIFTRFPFVVRVAVSGDIASATVIAPVFHTLSVGTVSPVWMSAAAIGDVLALTTSGYAYTVDATGLIDSVGAVDSWSTETRSWRVDGQTGTRIGHTLPELRRVDYRIVPAGREARYYATVARRIGPSIGPGEALSLPVSFDGDRTGRVFILDAGDHRVVVVDANGRYITEWGSRGSGPVQFELGEATTLPQGLDINGSLTVDNDGFSRRRQPQNSEVLALGAAAGIATDADPQRKDQPPPMRY